MAIRERTWVHNGIAKSAWQVDYIDRGRRLRKQFDRKKDAEAFHLKARVEVQNGTHTSDSNSITVAAAAQQWLDDCDRLGLERTTRVAYEQHVRIHINPVFGERKLSQLTMPMIADFERVLWAKGVSPIMVKRARTSLGAILSLAQDNGLVAQNVVKARGKAKANKRADGNRKLKVGVDIPSPAEVKALIPCLGNRRVLLLTAIFAGLRWSELAGLTWAAIDLKAGELHVTQRLDRYRQLGATKSEAGERTLPLGPYLTQALREHKLATGGQGFVFTTSRGTNDIRKLADRAFGEAQVAAGIVGADGAPKYTGLHCLRHFYASWCINRRADGGLELPLKTVQTRLGHSTIQITADTYSHLFPRTDDGTELAAGEAALLG